MIVLTLDLSLVYFQNSSQTDPLKSQLILGHVAVQSPLWFSSSLGAESKVLLRRKEPDTFCSQPSLTLSPATLHSADSACHTVLFTLLKHAKPASTLGTLSLCSITWPLLDNRKALSLPFFFVRSLHK